MLSKIVTLGDRIEITKSENSERRKLSDEKSVFDRPLISQVYDVIDETQLKIAMPIVEGRVVPLAVNGRFDICFITSGGLYKSRFVVLDRYKENGLYVLLIELVYELKKYQRRQYYRLEYMKDFEYIVIDEDTEKLIIEDENMIKEILDNNKLKKGIIIDISGGGIRFASRDKLEEKSKVLLKLDISLSNNKKVYGIMGKVLSSRSLLNDETTYEQRIEYMEIPNSTRETIIRYIFEQERLMRQKN